MKSVPTLTSPAVHFIRSVCSGITVYARILNLPTPTEVQVTAGYMNRPQTVRPATLQLAEHPGLRY